MVIETILCCAHLPILAQFVAVILHQIAFIGREGLISGEKMFAGAYELCDFFADWSHGLPPFSFDGPLGIRMRSVVTEIKRNKGAEYGGRKSVKASPS